MLVKAYFKYLQWRWRDVAEWLPQIRVYIEDVTTLTTTVPCTRLLGGKLNDNFRLVRIKVA